MQTDCQTPRVCCLELASDGARHETPMVDRGLPVAEVITEDPRVRNRDGASRGHATALLDSRRAPHPFDLNGRVVDHGEIEDRLIGAVLEDQPGRERAHLEKIGSRPGRRATCRYCRGQYQENVKWRATHEGPGRIDGESGSANADPAPSCPVTSMACQRAGDPGGAARVASTAARRSLSGTMRPCNGTM